MIEDLKECPFCSGDCELITQSKNEHYTYCKKCGAESDLYAHKSTAILAWNRRYVEKRLEEQVEDLKITIEEWKKYE